MVAKKFITRYPVPIYKRGTTVSLIKTHLVRIVLIEQTTIGIEWALTFWIFSNLDLH